MLQGTIICWSIMLFLIVGGLYSFKKDAEKKTQEKMQKEQEEIGKGVALEELDELILEAAEAVINAGICNTGGMSATFKISYHRAAIICNQLRNLGVIGTYDIKEHHSPVLITKEQLYSSPGYKEAVKYFAKKAKEAEEAKRQEEEREKERIKCEIERENRRKQTFIQECIGLGSNPADALVAWKTLQMEEDRDAELRHNEFIRQINYENDRERARRQEEEMWRENRRREHDEELRRKAAKDKYKRAVRRQYQSGIGDISRNLAKYDAQEALADLL